jgi:hypothetical protein
MASITEIRFYLDLKGRNFFLILRQLKLDRPETWCSDNMVGYYLLPGLDVVEVCSYRSTNDEAHVNFRVHKHVVAFPTSASSFS